MTKFRYLFLSCFLWLPCLCFGQSQDWLPVTPHDLEIKQVPDDPSASAIELYYADYRDDDKRYQFIYRRIKVLKDAGKEYADVNIPIGLGYHFDDVKARTIHPDGSIVEFTGKPIEKLVAKTRDFKFLAETFAMPDVTVGSIIEYKYRYHWERYVSDSAWEIQRDLYSLKQHWWLQVNSQQLTTSNYLIGEGTKLSYVVYGNIPKPQTTKSGAIELELEDIPAFKREEFAPPSDELRPLVRFFYGGNEVSSPEAFWQKYGREWFDQSERFIGNNDFVRNEAAKVVNGENDPEKKLRKLYARAQMTRNLTFERRRTRQEDKKEDLKPNENARDVLERGYGTHNDITRLFVAMARAAGFEARIARASDRKEFFFRIGYLVPAQLASEIAVIQMNGNDIFLDPGTEFCPFGLVRWIHTSDKGLKLDKTGGTFVVVPPATADNSQLRRIAKATLTPEGALKGTIDADFRGNIALEHRIAALEEDDAGRRKSLEDEAKGWMPDGSIVTLNSVEGWESSEEPLHVHFSVEIPSYASAVGKRLLVPTTLFRTAKQKEAFQSSDRKYSVYFPYAYEELDNLIFQVPDGYKAESVPLAQDVQLSSTRFAVSRSVTGNQFVSKRALIVNGIMFPVSRYGELRGFFDKLQAADEEQLVLQNAAIAAGK